MPPTPAVTDAPALDVSTLTPAAESRVTAIDLAAVITRAEGSETPGSFEGLACQYGVRDSYGTTFHPGCFSAVESLEGRLFPFLFMHDRAWVLGVFEAWEEEDGLYIKGQYDKTGVGEEARVRALSGSAPGLSVGFIRYLTDDAPDPEAITVARLVEVSQITLGMQAVPGSELTGVRAAIEDEAPEAPEVEVDEAAVREADAALFRLRCA